MSAAVTRITFTNPTAAEHFIEVVGNSFQIEDMTAGNDDAANRTTIHAGQYIENGGIPVLNRTRVQFAENFDRLIVHQNSGATASNTVTILIWDNTEIDLALPSI